MIIGYSSATVFPKALYQATGMKYDYYIIQKVQRYDRYWAIFDMIPIKDWVPQWDNKITVDQQYFLDGSGFGGGPCFIPDYWYEHDNGSIYRRLYERD